MATRPAGSACPSVLAWSIHVESSRHCDIYSVQPGRLAAEIAANSYILKECQMSPNPFQKVRLTSRETARLDLLKSSIPGSPVNNPESREISTADRRRIESQCSNQFNWSDGGHWIGPGPKPTCFQSATMKGSGTVIWSFPSDQSAQKWNTDWEAAIRKAGHLGTAVVTVAAARVTGSLGAILVGVLAAVIKDELQARIQYPRAHRGWRYSFQIDYRYIWSPHPWKPNSFTKQYCATMFNHVQP